VSFAAVTLCVASKRVFIVVSIYFVIGSVRKLLDTPSYRETMLRAGRQVLVPGRDSDGILYSPHHCVQTGFWGLPIRMFGGYRQLYPCG
jgi:hypothetical protein